MDLAKDVARYASGEMDAVEIVQLFQDLDDTGLVWRLPGDYGRAAMTLICAGLVLMARQSNGS